MSYNAAIPQPLDTLDVSQGQLLQNFGQLDSTFAIDHVTYSNLTANKGFHNQVTSPPQGAPPATGANPILYGYTPAGNAGTLQFSRGPSNAVSSPLTRLHSGTAGLSLAAGNYLNVFDFTGMGNTSFQLIAYDASSSSSILHGVGFWSGAGLAVQTMLWSISLALQLLLANASGNTLRIFNNYSAPFNNIYWSLEFQRLG